MRAFKKINMPLNPCPISQFCHVEIILLVWPFFFLCARLYWYFSINQFILSVYFLIGYEDLVTSQEPFLNRMLLSSWFISIYIIMTFFLVAILSGCFMCLWGICISLLEKYQFKHFAHFFQLSFCC